MFAPLYRRYQTLGRRNAAPEADDVEATRVKRAQQGDAAVWDEWFEEYYQSLFRYAYIRMRNKADAEDLVSQVFVEAYRGIEKYHHTGRPLLAWLYRIAHNLIFDSQKALARREDLVATDDVAFAVADGPESLILSIDLENALDTLVPEQREVIILRYFLAMSAHEAAEVIGKTQTAVFSLQARALVNLRNSLGEGALP